VRKTKDATPSAPQEVIPPSAGGKAGKKADDRDHELEGFMQEIEDDLRDEELRKLWDRYGKLVIALAAAIILVAIGVQVWRQHVTEQRVEIANRFAVAQRDLVDGKNDDAFAIFGDVAKSRGEGYAILADLNRAAILVEKKDVDGAVQIYKAVAADTKADPALRDAATILQVLHTMDTADPKTLEPLLSALTNPANPYHNLAIELSAVLAGKEGDRARAAKLAEQLLNDPDTSPDMRKRAQDLAAFYKSNSELPAPQPPAAVAPAPAATPSTPAKP
jgi:hypothetical protein